MLMDMGTRITVLATHTPPTHTATAMAQATVIGGGDLNEVVIMLRLVIAVGAAAVLAAMD